MKILITSDVQSTLALHGLKNAEDLIKLTESDTKICLLSAPLSPEEIEKLPETEFRMLSLGDLIRQSAIASPPEFKDIVSRPETPVDQSVLESFYRNRVILVTGGEGYIGSEIVAHLLSLPIKQVIAFGHGENSINELIKKHGQHKNFKAVLGDVRDEEKLRRVFLEHKPNTIFHAAAHKHVPILEMYPEEAVKTNILGTKKLVSLAAEWKVERFVLVSTDKAVNPVSALGASKRIAEKICLSMDALIPDCRFATVRFGNVFGSTGSVVPTFLEQIAHNRPLTITDKNMLRYFMSIHEAVRLVLLAGTMDYGNLFSFDMGVPIALGELLEKLCAYYGVEPSQSCINVIGNRGGEKFSEELIHSFEKILASPHEKLLILEDSGSIWSEKEINLLYAEFSDAASFGSKEEIFALFNKYISHYAGMNI